MEKANPTLLSAASEATQSLPGSNSMNAEGVEVQGAQVSANIFDGPIDTSAPLAVFAIKTNHPVSRAGIVNSDGVPVGTNKFWGNLVLADGTQGVFTQPYQIWVNKDTISWGASISHNELSDMAYGPNPNANPVQYYISPVGRRSLSLSAVQFDPTKSSMTTEQLTPHSALLNLWANKQTNPTNMRLSVFLVQGMGFVSGRYLHLTPKFDSNIGIQTFQYIGEITGNGSTRRKWRVVLADGREWRIYSVANAKTTPLTLNLVNANKIQAAGLFSGIVQIAKLPSAPFESTLDAAAGAYPTTATLAASVSGAVATYNFTFTRAGSNNAQACFMYALAHHVASFDSTTSAKLIPGMQLKATTKGLMTAIVSDSWILVENQMPTGVAWLSGNVRSFSATALATMSAAAASEIQDDISSLSNVNSQYFAGKALARYAQIVLVASDVLNDRTMAMTGLNKLKAAFQRFTTNQQQVPLVYDSTWGGIVSSSWWLTGDPGADFGNAYYNDHHFHYGYFVYAAAVLAHIEQGLTGQSSWLTENKSYVNNLIRDVANPSVKDNYFPVSRNFDFWNGHSWATGLYSRADGKDEESTSEDYNFSYGMKLWANVIGDQNMEARANLQLAILKRSLNTYFLMTNGSTIQPANFIQNKVTGIMFENKIDHTTYFGTDTYLIEGIHMIPLTPISPYIRQKTFCAEEWAYYFQGKTDSINNGWRGILFANAALFSPSTSWNFFQSSSFSNAYLDDGASRTWYLAFAAGLGGSTTPQSSKL